MYRVGRLAPVLLLALAACSDRPLDVPELVAEIGADGGTVTCAPINASADDDLCAGAPTDAPLSAPTPPPWVVMGDAPTGCLSDPTAILMPIWSATLLVPKSVTAYSSGAPLVDSLGDSTWFQIFDGGGQRATYDAAGSALTTRTQANVMLDADDRTLILDAPSYSIVALDRDGSAAWTLPLGDLYKSVFGPNMSFWSLACSS